MTGPRGTPLLKVWWAIMWRSLLIMALVMLGELLVFLGVHGPASAPIGVAAVALGYWWHRDSVRHTT